VSVRKSRKCEENVTSKRCGLATFTECVPLPPEARGLNASTAGSHKTYNSWRARSCFEHTKQAKVGGQSAGPKACLALLAERKQQWMLSRRRERLPFPLSRSPVRTFRVLLGRFIPLDASRLDLDEWTRLMIYACVHARAFNVKLG
jgi:hypothetical protein